MRIIHDVENEMQVGAGITPYRHVRGWQGYGGIRVEFCIADLKHPGRAIYIEGNAKYLRPMLEQMLLIVDDSERIAKERVGEKRPTACPSCDPFGPDTNATHTEECDARRQAAWLVAKGRQC